MDKDKQRILDFVKSYPEIFDEHEKKYIEYYTGKGRDDLFLPDLIRELYDYFGIIPEEKNIYLGFIELLQSQFDIRDSHIIEVGGGIFPTLARRIARLQNRGTITVYDPMISAYESGNTKLELVRNNFTPSTDVSNTDLLIGFMPCKGAEDLIESATSHEIDFMVALCEGGLHGEPYDYFESDQEWIDNMFYRASRGIEDHQMGELGIQYMKKYANPYPVIYNKR